MRLGPFGWRGRGRENGFRCPRRVIAVIAALFLAGCMSGDHGVKRMAGAGLAGRPLSRTVQRRSSYSFAGPSISIRPNSPAPPQAVRGKSRSRRPSPAPPTDHPSPKAFEDDPVSRTDQPASSIPPRTEQPNRRRESQPSKMCEVNGVIKRSGEVRRCLELSQKPFRGHSETCFGGGCLETETPLRCCLSSVLFGCGGWI